MTTTPKVILVPVDGSDSANKAVALAAWMASHLQLPMKLLFVFPRTPTAMFGLPGGGMSREERQFFQPGGFEKLRDEAAAEAFRRSRPALDNLEVDVEEVVLAGIPADAIVDHANELDGALIIMGRRGLSHLKEFLLGSVSERVLRHAHCPVMIAG
ncbi:universal stress protein [Marinobacter sp.]|uniref:universal stress protein n=1 Tax=Marinobacter sp. TaxID=50741 RepID=UPI00384D33AE